MPTVSDASAPASSGNDSGSTSSSASSARACARWMNSGLPESLKLLTRFHNGLILVTGSVGSGKSTTLAALVEQVNWNGDDHIITWRIRSNTVFEPKGCHITQREVHTHTKSFGAALRGFAARRSGRHHGRRNARPRDHLARHHRFGDGPPCAWHAAYRQRLAHARPFARRLSQSINRSRSASW